MHTIDPSNNYYGYQHQPQTYESSNDYQNHYIHQPWITINQNQNQIINNNNKSSMNPKIKININSEHIHIFQVLGFVLVSFFFFFSIFLFMFVCYTNTKKKKKKKKQIFRILSPPISWRLKTKKNISNNDFHHSPFNVIKFAQRTTESHASYQIHPESNVLKQIQQESNTHHPNPNPQNQNQNYKYYDPCIQLIPYFNPNQHQLNNNINTNQKKNFVLFFCGFFFLL